MIPATESLGNLVLAAGLAPGSFSLAVTPTRATITYDASVPQSQRAMADALVAAFDPSDEAQEVRDEEAHPERTAARQAAAQAVQNNLDYLGIADGATAAQVRDQVKQLTRQMNVVIRRLVQLD